MRSSVRISVALAGLLVSSCKSSERKPDSELETARLACAFDRGATPSETIGREFPVGRAIPIDHFILLMQENRSFDHYLGTMPGVDGYPASASNPDAMGNPVAPYHESAYCIDDVAHSWVASHAEYSGGTNQGFVVTNDPNGQRAMGYYDETDIPFYRALYATFAMSDRHFCSVLGPTWVNRWFYTAATSFGRTTNTILPESTFTAYVDEAYTIYQRLDEAGVDWAVYYSDAPFAFGGYSNYAFDHLPTNFFPIDRFYRDLDAGTLPAVVWVEPSYVAGVDLTDEHPPASPQPGQAFVAQIVDAVMASSIWSHSAIVLTYDEHGGYYDHVPPPSACVPDDYVAAADDGTPRAEGFDRYGFRVPLVVVSPYSRPGFVSHHPTDHTSILRLVEARFGLPALTRRDANAWPLLDLFDFENPAFLTPPNLPAATIDPAKLDACHLAYP